MKLASRPEESVIGSGPYAIKLTFEQLQLISSVLYVTRLGTGQYQEAAFELLNTITDAFGDDFIEQSAIDVNLCVSILDDEGEALAEYPSDDFCLEVN